jgi:polyisoprenoid-binding protein YceI
LNQISAKNIDKKNANFMANASLDLTITGQTKSYNIPFETNRSDKRFHLKGKKRINIRDFGLEPPITMLGMIRVSEWIDIEIITDFDVSKIQDTASR